MSITELRIEAIQQLMADGAERSSQDIADDLFESFNATYHDLFGGVKDPVSSIRDACKVACMRQVLRARPGKRGALYRTPDAAARSVSHNWSK